MSAGVLQNDGQSAAIFMPSYTIKKNYNLRKGEIF